MMQLIEISEILLLLQALSNPHMDSTPPLYRCARDKIIYIPKWALGHREKR